MYGFVQYTIVSVSITTQLTKTVSPFDLSDEWYKWLKLLWLQFSVFLCLYLCYLMYYISYKHITVTAPGTAQFGHRVQSINCPNFYIFAKDRRAIAN